MYIHPSKHAQTFVSLLIADVGKLLLSLQIAVQKEIQITWTYLLRTESVRLISKSDAFLVNLFKL